MSLPQQNFDLINAAIDAEIKSNTEQEMKLE